MLTKNDNGLRTWSIWSNDPFPFAFIFPFPSGRMVYNLYLLTYLFALQLKRFTFEIYEFGMGMDLPFALKQFSLCN